MLPGGALAAAFLLSLVPGWVFLWSTEGSREPREKSALYEVLEVVAVGVFTTGLSIGVWVYFQPEAIFDLAQTPDDAHALQRSGGMVAVVLGMATGLALAASAAFRHFGKERYAPGVWKSVLSRKKVPKGYLPYIGVEVEGGHTIEGVLSHYTMSPDSTHRDIALLKPVYRDAAGRVRRPPHDFVIVPGETIKQISLNYALRNPPKPEGVDPPDAAPDDRQVSSPPG